MRWIQKKEEPKIEKAVTILLGNLPKKCEDLSMFALSCKIRKKKLDNVIVDLGASIDIMPASIFSELKLLNLESYDIIVQLTDNSLTKPL